MKVPMRLDPHNCRQMGREIPLITDAGCSTAAGLLIQSMHAYSFTTLELHSPTTMQSSSVLGKERCPIVSSQSHTKCTLPPISPDAEVAAPPHAKALMGAELHTGGAAFRIALTYLNVHKTWGFKYLGLVPNKNAYVTLSHEKKMHLDTEGGVWQIMERGKVQQDGLEGHSSHLTTLSLHHGSQGRSAQISRSMERLQRGPDQGVSGEAQHRDQGKYQPAQRSRPVGFDGGLSSGQSKPQNADYAPHS